MELGIYDLRWALACRVLIVPSAYTALYAERQAQHEHALAEKELSDELEAEHADFWWPRK